MSILEQLRAKFDEKDLEWKPQTLGISNGKPWLMPVPYVQARAIQNRLDEIFGWNGWQVEYREESPKNIICKLSILVDDKWISKEDGASETDIECFKGGISSAFKRVASSGFGIGRYLYDYDIQFAECSLEKKEGWNKAKTKDGKYIYWKTPTLKKSTNKEPKTEVNMIYNKDLEVPRFTCDICGEKITESVATLSQHKYHKNLCLKCFRKEGEK